jgi:hypothetical protein
MISKDNIVIDVLARLRTTNNTIWEYMYITNIIVLKTYNSVGPNVKIR